LWKSGDLFLFIFEYSLIEKINFRRDGLNEAQPGELCCQVDVALGRDPLLLWLIPVAGVDACHSACHARLIHRADRTAGVGTPRWGADTFNIVDAAPAPCGSGSAHVAGGMERGRPPPDLNPCSSSWVLSARLIKSCVVRESLPEVAKTRVPRVLLCLTGSSLISRSHALVIAGSAPSPNCATKPGFCAMDGAHPVQAGQHMPAR
jgi:hypothetical protein